MENDERQKLWKRIHGLEKDVSMLIDIMDRLVCSMPAEDDADIEYRESASRKLEQLAHERIDRSED